jgi:sugar phosphate isomerase/epimerase
VPVSKEGQALLDTIRKHDLHPQLWVMAGVTPEADQAKTIESAASALRPLARQAAEMKCQIALYNHGGWFGEPVNQIAIIDRLKRDGFDNVGIVYNLHHGHDDLDRFSDVLAKVKPHLLCLNLNGMTKDGDKTGKKILPIAQGDLDLQILKTIKDSSYTGPIGILNHTDEDAEARLKENMQGLAKLTSRLGE